MLRKQSSHNVAQRRIVVHLCQRLFICQCSFASFSGDFASESSSRGLLPSALYIIFEPTQSCDSTMHELPEEDSMQAKFNPSSCLPDIVSASTAFPLSGMVSFAQLVTTSWFQ